MHLNSLNILTSHTSKGSKRSITGGHYDQESKHLLKKLSTYRFPPAMPTTLDMLINCLPIDDFNAKNALFLSTQ